MPDVSAATFVEPPVVQRRIPEVTFTPTAVGLCSGVPSNQLDLHSMLSDALAKILAAGIQQEVGNLCQTVNSQPQAQGHFTNRPIAFRSS